MKIEKHNRECISVQTQNIGSGCGSDQKDCIVGGVNASCMFRGSCQLEVNVDLMTINTYPSPLVLCYVGFLGDLLYKTEGGDRQKFRKVILKGTRILFCGCGPNNFLPLRGTKSVD